MNRFSAFIPRHISLPYRNLVLSETRRFIASMGGPVVPARRPNVAIFVCDMQEKFRPVIWEFETITKTAQKVLKAANVLGIPIHTTVQNQDRLGATVPELASLLPESAPPVVDKSRFSMMVPEIAARLAGSERKEQWTVALVGIESHICVTQTALDLRNAGHRAYVLADAVSSANKDEVPLALARLRAESSGGAAAGRGGGGDEGGLGSITVTSSESFLYEIMRDASIPEFRDVLKVVKETAEDTKNAAQTLLSRAG